jgi:hypothetical protein
VPVDRVDPHDCPRNVPGSTARQEEWSEDGGGIPDIPILGPTAFDDLLASEQVVRTFFLRVGDFTGLLGATLEGITDGERDTPRTLDGKHRSCAGTCGKQVSRREP